MGKVIILGPKGRFGQAAVKAFQDADWEVCVFGRHLDPAAFPGATCFQGDGQDSAALSKACSGSDVIVHTINPPYPAWAKEMPGLTRAVITAARATGATVLIPGNIYNYGQGMPARLTEQTPWRPTTRKGVLRVTMEEALRDSGVRTIVLRGGDFIETAQTGGWFAHHIIATSHQGQTLYPGPLDQVHAWAYLPDMARAAVALAEQRTSFEAFEEFGFGGYGVTGQELIDQIGTALGVPQRHKGLPWPLLRLLGFFAPLLREVSEMRYLWKVPHQVDGAKLLKALPDFVATPFPEAIRHALAHCQEDRANE